MKFRILFPQEEAIYDERGWLLRGKFNGQIYVYDKSEGESNGIVGIWNDDLGETELWEDILPRLKATIYRLPNSAFLHNGQVNDEAEILRIDMLDDDEKTIIKEFYPPNREFQLFLSAEKMKRIIEALDEADVTDLRDELQTIMRG